MGDVAPGKTTFEIPDTVFRRAESVAAHRGIPIIDFVTPFRVCLGVVGLDACASAYTSPGVGAPTTSRMADHWLKTAGSNALSRQVREPQAIKIGAFFT